MPDEASTIFSPCHCAVLRKASRHVSQIYDEALAPTGLKTTQFSLLAAIHRASDRPPTMGELAGTMVMDRSTLGQNLRPLERDRLVTLRVGKEDARRREILLTRKGRAALAEAHALWRKVQERFEISFGTRATARLRRALLELAATKF